MRLFQFITTGHIQILRIISHHKVIVHHYIIYMFVLFSMCWIESYFQRIVIIHYMPDI